MNVDLKYKTVHVTDAENFIMIKSNAVIVDSINCDVFIHDFFAHNRLIVLI